MAGNRLDERLIEWTLRGRNLKVEEPAHRQVTVVMCSCGGFGRRYDRAVEVKDVQVYWEAKKIDETN